jgi:hypothetical protein
MEIREYVQLENHLHYNFVPPLNYDEAMRAATEAIDFVNAGEGWRGVETPNGKVMQAWDVVEELRLEFFITLEDWADV